MPAARPNDLALFKIMLIKTRDLESKVSLFNGQDISLEYLLVGNESVPTILFVHGVSADMRQFLPQVKFFADKYQILLVSLRGHGRSSNPTRMNETAFNFAAFAQDLWELIQHLGINQLHYVGNSMGGMTGYELLAQHPNLFLSLTTFDTAVFMNIPPFLAKAGSRSVPMMVKVMGKQRYANLVAKQTGKTPETVAILADAILPNIHPQAVYLAQCNIARYDYTAVLQKMKRPYLILERELDRGGKLMKSTFAFAQANDHVHLIKIPNAGHIANLDQPELFNEHLATFLQSSQS